MKQQEPMMTEAEREETKRLRKLIWKYRATWFALGLALNVVGLVVTTVWVRRRKAPKRVALESCVWSFLGFLLSREILRQFGVVLF